MDKPVIFISHITEERELANLIKDSIDSSFLGIADTFVSSNNNSIETGMRWLDTISENLEKAALIIIVCSEQSIKRPWINFEAGAGWVKRIPVIPVCHTGLKPSDLPIPLNMLQGVEANNNERMQTVYDKIARVIGIAAPVLPNDFVTKVKEFEDRFGFLDTIERHLNAIYEVLPELRLLFSSESDGRNARGRISQANLNTLEPHLNALEKLGLIQFNREGSIMSADGFFYDTSIMVSDKYFEEIQPKIFKHP